MKTLKSLFLVAVCFFFVASVSLEACTTAIISAGASYSGRPMLWKQRDSKNTDNVIRYVSGGKYSYSGLFETSDIDCNSCYGGANEVGFAIMNNLSSNLNAVNTGGKGNGWMMAQALSNCATVEEFIAFVETLPHPLTQESNFGVMDAKGSVAYVEVGDVKVTRYDAPKNGWLVRSNYSLSGRKNEGGGYARYETAFYLASSHQGKFTPEDLIDGFGRSFYNHALGIDMSKAARNGAAIDQDFIPRLKTASSICIEGVTDADRPDGSVIWTAIGYTPCTYTVPVWVAAKSEIPAFITSGETGLSSTANRLADKLLHKAHELDGDMAGTYVDFNYLLPVMKTVRKAEKKEMKEGKRLNALFRKSGFDIRFVSEYNRAALERFGEFEQQFNL